MADKFTRDLLRDWGLEILIESFRDADMNEDAMNALLPTDVGIIDSLIPSIGKRIIFKHKLALLKSDVIFVEPGNISEASTSTQDTFVFERPEPSISLASTVELVGKVNARNQMSGPVKQTRFSKNSSMLPALPELTANLQAALDQGILQKSRPQQLALIRFFGTYVRGTISDPRRIDYTAFSLAIIQKYPFVADNSENGNAIVRNQLSKYVRNQNHEQNLRLKGICRKRPGKRPLQTKASVVCQKKPQKSDSLLIKELIKKGAKSSSHIEQLLKQTAVARRKFVSAANSCHEILQKFPHLSNIRLFMYDFGLMLDITNLEATFDTVTSKLCGVFRLPEDEVTSEVTKLKMFIRLLCCLHPRPRKDNRPVLELFEAGEEFDMEALDMQGPCVLVFHNKEVCDAFLLCEKTVGCHAPLRKAFEVIMLLIGAYFVMDRAYPAPYKNFLNFLHCEVLGLKNSGFVPTIAYLNFMKQFNRA